MVKDRLFRIAVTLVVVLGLATTAQAALVSYWSFDDGTGTIATDSLPNARNGTLSGNTAWVAGHTGGAGDYALDFDNSNDYVTVGTPHEFNFAKTDPFSAGVWINHDGVQSPQTTTAILTTFKGSQPYDGWGIIIMGTTGAERNLQFQIDGGEKSIAVDVVDSLAINEWVHVAVTHDGTDAASGMKFYVNGAEVSTTPASWSEDGQGGTPTLRPLKFGSYENASRDYSGLMDDIAIFDHTLSPAEVTTLYEGGYLPPKTQWTQVDISSHFDADTIAVDTNDSAGVGYKGSLNEKFLVGTQFPPNGQLASYQLGPYDGDNTILLNIDESVTIDVDNDQYLKVGVLHTSVGLDSDTNGTVTLHYADGSEEELVWDVADSDGTNSDGSSTTALTGLDRYSFSLMPSIVASDEVLWTQTFDVDDAKVLDTIVLSTVGVVDADGAEFGIYAISTGKMEVSEPIPGDANEDGIVNDQDASILAAHWQQSGMGWGDGDFNGDGNVNDQDASILAANWQSTGEEGAPVPEPSVLILLLSVGLIGLLARARRRR